MNGSENSHPSEELLLALAQKTLAASRAAEINRHLEECDACFLRYSALAASLEEWQSRGKKEFPPAPKDLRRRLRERYPQTRKKRRSVPVRRRFFLQPAWTAATASALLLLLLMLIWKPEQLQKFQSPPLSPAPGKVAAPVQTDAEPVTTAESPPAGKPALKPSQPAREPEPMVTPKTNRAPAGNETTIADASAPFESMATLPPAEEPAAALSRTAPLKIQEQPFSGGGKSMAYQEAPRALLRFSAPERDEGNNSLKAAGTTWKAVPPVDTRIRWEISDRYLRLHLPDPEVHLVHLYRHGLLQWENTVTTTDFRIPLPPAIPGDSLLIRLFTGENDSLQLRFWVSP